MGGRNRKRERVERVVLEDSVVLIDVQMFRGEKLQLFAEVRYRYRLSPN